MANLEAIRSELESDPLGRGYSAMTAQQAADDLNAGTRQITVPIPVPEIRRYLFVNNKWLSIKKGTDTTAEMARDALSMFDAFRVTESDVAATVNNLLDALISAGYITAEDKAAVQAMGVRVQSRAKELGILGRSPEIGPAHIEQARAL